MKNQFISIEGDKGFLNLTQGQRFYFIIPHAASRCSRLPDLCIAQILPPNFIDTLQALSKPAVTTNNEIEFQVHNFTAVTEPDTRAACGYVGYFFSFSQIAWAISFVPTAVGSLRSGLRS